MASYDLLSEFCKDSWRCSYRECGKVPFGWERTQTWCSKGKNIKILNWHYTSQFWPNKSKSFRTENRDNVITYQSSNDEYYNELQWWASVRLVRGSSWMGYDDPWIYIGINISMMHVWLDGWDEPFSVWLDGRMWMEWEYLINYIYYLKNNKN